MSKLVATTPPGSRLAGKLVIYWPYLLLIAVALIVLFPLWLGRFYAIGDMRDVFIPLEKFFHDELLRGRLPAWNPDAAWGFPVIASAQIGFFYPPLLLLRALPLPLYLPLILALHTVAILVGMYCLLRTYRVSTAAALLGAISFGLSAFVWQHLTHLNIFLIVAWFPWQLWLVRILIRRGISPRQGIATLWVALAMPFLIGQFQVPAMMMVCTLIFFIYERGKVAARTTRTVATTLVIAVIVFALAAVQLLPTLELVSQSSRSSSKDFSIERANQHSWPLYHLPTILFPRFFGNDDTYWGKRLEIEYGFFVGTLPLVLALWYLVKTLRIANKRLRFTDSRNYYWFYLIIFSFLLALGDLSPLRLLGLEPSLWYFSAPARWLLFTSFGLAILASFGFDAVLQHRRQFYRTAHAAISVLGVFCMAINALIFVSPTILQEVFVRVFVTHPGLFAGQSGQYYAAKLTQLLGSVRESSVSLTVFTTYIPFIVLTLVLIPRRAGHMRAMMLMLTLVELLFFAMTTTPTLPWKDILSPPAMLGALPQAVLDKQARVISLREGGDTGAYFTNPQTRANIITRRLQRELLVPLTHTQFSVPGIEWPASLDLRNQIVARERLQATDNPYSLDLEYAREVNIGSVLVPRGQLFSLGNPAATTRTVTAYEIPTRPRAEIIDPMNPRATGQPAVYTEHTPVLVTIEAEAAKGGLLVIRDTFYPGWQATVNGINVPIQAYNEAFRAITLPSGKHDVRLEYVPRLLYWGLLISGIALLLTILLLLPRRMLRLPYGH